MKKLMRFVAVFVVLNVLRASACADLDDGEARLDFLASRIERDDFGVAPGAPFDGEWILGTLSMSSVAAMNLAMRDPSTRDKHAAQVSDWAKRLGSEAVRAYDTRMWGGRDALATLEGPDGHAGYLGHVVLAMDAACLLGAPRDATLHEALVNSLARRIDTSTTGLIETYPGETYVPDNVVVMASLMQFDACVGEPRHAALEARWKAKLRAKWIDPANGVLVFAPGQPARGSGAAWNAFYLSLVDEPFAAEQSELMWKSFGDTALVGWLGGIREWPVGVEGRGDVDSGPLIAGISPSATGFALGDASLRGRAERSAILRTAELVGVSWNGRYLTAPLVGDAITLAARTRTPWSPAVGAIVLK